MIIQSDEMEIFNELRYMEQQNRHVQEQHEINKTMTENVKIL